MKEKITLGDFWWIQNVLPEMDDKKGTSLIAINSSKGQALIDSIKDSIVIQEVRFDTFEKYNPSFVKSSSMNKNRDNFMNEINDNNFDVLVNKYIKKPSLLKKVLGKVKRIIKKLKKYKKHFLISLYANRV